MKDLAHKALKFYTRSFPISKGKNRVLSRLWKPLSFGQYKRQAMLSQSNVRVSCDLTKLIQRSLYFYGSYETAETDLWIKLARNSRIIFDVGANIGLWALLAASVNEESEVHAFEPTGEIVAALRGNIELNGFHNILVNAFGIGRSTGKGFLHYCTSEDGSNEGMNFVTDSASQSSDFPVNLTSIDDYSEQKGIKHIDLLKIDVEGGEYNALCGARKLLQNQSVGCIFIELIEWAAKRGGHSTFDIKHLLAGYGYQIYRLQSGKLVNVQMKDVHHNDNVIAFTRLPDWLPVEAIR